MSDVLCMYQADVYSVDPASVANGHWVGLIAFGATALFSALLVRRFGWRSWWAIIITAVVVPTLAVLVAGGAQPSVNWPLTDFVVDVVMPLAVVGGAAAVVGIAVGAALRWLLRREAT